METIRNSYLYKYKYLRQHKLETIICGTVTGLEVRQTTYYGLHTSPTGI